MVSNKTQHPPPHSHTLSVYTCTWGGGGWEGWGQREGRGTTVHNTNMTDCISINKNQKRRHFEFGVFIIPSSMRNTYYRSTHLTGEAGLVPGMARSPHQLSNEDRLVAPVDQALLFIL